MKIGIIGSGNMGRSIGVRFAHLGHEVFFGARRPEQSAKAAALAGKGARHGTNDEAAAFGDVLVWTMRQPDPAAVLRRPAVLDGRVVIDLNNRNYGQEVKSGAWFAESIAETLQNNAPRARVVKALNTIAMEAFDTSPERLTGAGAQTFLAGDHTEAKEDVAKLVGDLGFEAVDLGSGPAAFRAAEALGDVIRLLMIDGQCGGRAHLVLKTLPAPDLDTIGVREASNYG